jgi:hypothetical protein
MSVPAAVATMAVAAMSVEATPASAIIKFCTASVCTPNANGCSSPTSTNVTILADNGDSFIASDGTKWTCTNGKWVKSAASQIIHTYGPVLGLGLYYQGPPPADPCDYSSYFRDPELGIPPCQNVIP